ncbi:MAG: hypothetical protein U0800_18940 [Isosphaeraceae bacterium]
MRDGRQEWRLDKALEGLGARAAGHWALQGNSLVQRDFRAASDMPEEIARAFAEATRVVPLDRLELGIVRAAAEGLTAVSVASELDPAAGSGYWLRAFGADRSIAVPRFDASGRVSGVSSVAMIGGNPDAETLRSILGAIDRDQG